ncbi:hypothetical protein RI210_12875 [Methylomonas koyamae]|nr:hypothetical protein [Methylomonas koyamae]WNB78223.1 hypothetical protein RI210_12875 [Methylomonas koyamae]
MKIAFFADPAPVLDQLLMHERNLAGRAAETDKARFQPKFAGWGSAELTADFRSWWRRQDWTVGGRAPVDSFAAVIAVSAAIF